MTTRAGREAEGRWTCLRGEIRGEREEKECGSEQGRERDSAPAGSRWRAEREDWRDDTGGEAKLRLLRCLKP